MLDITRLKYSLTKFGTYKIAQLLTELPAEKVINVLENTGVADRAAVEKVLSAQKGKELPILWTKIQQYGQEDIQDVIFFALVLSHHELIATVGSAIETNEGMIDRDYMKIGTTVKPYTNFARSAIDLGMTVDIIEDAIQLDIARIFHKPYIVDLLRELIVLKLRDANWDGKLPMWDAAVSMGIHAVFGLSSNDFKMWIEGDVLGADLADQVPKPERIYQDGLRFKQGHSPKFEGKVMVRNPTDPVEVTLVHNRLQTKIYNVLVKLYPEDEFGTENSTNIGSVDIVRKGKDGYTFYELKTASNVRTSIRQAISQLLEYGYWKEVSDLKELIVVAPNPPTEAAREYLLRLRTTFNLPIYYQYFDEDSLILNQRI